MRHRVKVCPVASLDDDGYLHQSLEDLIEICPPEAEVEPDELKTALSLLQSFDPAGVGARNVGEFMAGPYRVPHVKIDSALWMTNKTPVGTYRGPGRFEANFFLERMIDLIAAELGIDRIEFRRKNLITAKEQPYPIATVQPTNAVDEYDSGEYRETLERALKEFDWPRVSKLQGKLIDGKYHDVDSSELAFKIAGSKAFQAAAKPAA